MSNQSWDYTLGPDHPDYVEDIVEARRRWLGHDEFCPAQASDDAPCVCTRLAKARADEREKIAQAIEAARLDPNVQGRLTVENRDYPLTRDDILIINGVRNADARIARSGGSDE